MKSVYLVLDMQNDLVSEDGPNGKSPLGAQIGGKAWLRSSLPGAEEVSSIYDYQTESAQRAGARLELGVMADASMVGALKPDTVILATGATMLPRSWLPQQIAEAGWVPDLRGAMADLIGLSARQPGTAVVYDMDHSEGTYAAGNSV